MRRKSVIGGAIVAAMIIAATVLSIASPTKSSAASLRMTCDSGDAHFLGVRGSGQGAVDASTRHLGGEVYTVYREAKKEMDRAGLTLSDTSLTYPAAPVNTLLNWNVSAGMKQYVGSISQGENSLSNELNLIAARWDRQQPQCRNAKFMLAGYSQGAMVIHRVLQNPSLLSPSALRRIGSVILLGDGDRFRRDGSQQGVIPPRSDGVGQAYPAASGSKRVVFPASLKSQPYGVCWRGDFVCNHVVPLGGIQAYPGVDAHLNAYKNIDSIGWRTLGGNWYRTAVDGFIADTRNFVYPPFNNDPTTPTATPPTTPTTTTPSNPPTTPPTTPPATTTPPSNPTDWTASATEQGCSITITVNRKSPPNLPRAGFWFLRTSNGQQIGGAPYSTGTNQGKQAVQYADSGDYQRFGAAGSEVTFNLEVEPPEGTGAEKQLTIKLNTPSDNRCSPVPVNRPITVRLS